MSDTLNGVAIIGMSGRFPKAKNIKEFWKNISEGMDCITFYKDEELEAEGIEKRVLDNERYVKAKGEVEHVDYFDAKFFGYTPREAEIMDPQHRMFLECAWEAMEDAGYDPDREEGRVGVFAGESMSTYMMLNVLPNIDTGYASATSLQAAIGNDKDSLTTTVTYKMNLRGAGVTIQSSSSTSLVAVSMACQSLLNYQCDMILAGGVSLGAPQKNGYMFEDEGIVSPDGHCRPYDERGHGFVPGTGLGVVLLKRLDEAIEDGDHIYAAIKGFAINNDGSQKVSYSAPSSEAQTEVIMEAQGLADFSPETITYVEGHGTATKMGDVIEVSALTQAFRSATNKKNFCALGSVKSNIGHLDTAAGVVGLIKAALCIHNKQIPPTVHFNKANPQLNLEDSPFFVPTQLMDWNPTGCRRAGVSSFGMGGTNSHVVMEEVPVRERRCMKSRKWKMLMLSAKTDGTLTMATKQMSDFLLEKKDVNLADLTYTSQVGRKRFDKRRVILCNDADGAIADIAKENIQTVFTNKAVRGANIVFMFPGQGAQYINMSRSIYESEVVFRSIVDQCRQLIQPHIDFDFLSVLFSNEEDDSKQEALLSNTKIVQPVMFVIEYALAKLFMSWGIVPDALIGHSLGEYTAACVSGMISLEDALILVANRGRLMSQLPKGMMMSVSMSPEEANKLADEYEGVSIAAINGSLSCVLSGDVEIIRRLKQKLDEQGVLCRQLKNNHAFHSKSVECITDEFRKVLEKIAFHKLIIPIVSNFSGTYMTPEMAADKEYWVNHLRNTVLFMDGVTTLLENKNTVFIEVGPGKTLASFVGQHVDIGALNHVLTTMRHHNEEMDDLQCLFASIGRLWTIGIDINWNNFYEEEDRRRVSFPTYPFERKSYWIKAPKSRLQGKEVEVNEPEREEDVVDIHQEMDENRSELSSEYKAPRNETEEKMVLIWENLLGIRPIGIHDNFFELGGNSLGVTQLFSRIYNTFHINMNYKEFFSEPTIAVISSAIGIEVPLEGNDEEELTELLDEIEDLTEDQVEELLNAAATQEV